MRSASLILCALISWSCSQPLPPITTRPTSVPADFFWSAPQLDSSISYSIDRGGTTTEHPIRSSDGVHVFDQSAYAMAFRIVSRGDTIAIDSLGANSLFRLPAGYYFADEDSVQEPGLLRLLERAHLVTDGSWHAGIVAGYGLGSGIEITGRVLDHVDTLLVPQMKEVPAASYGETFMIRYAHETAKDSVDRMFPLFWKVYYSRGRGPVLIEEYRDSTQYNASAKYSLQSQAILTSH